MKLLCLPILMIALVPSTQVMAGGIFSGNTSLTYQRGNHNAASTILNGSRNLATIVQLGDNHSYNYAYSGDDRSLTVVQATTKGLDYSFTLSSGNSTLGSTIVIQTQAAP